MRNSPSLLPALSDGIVCGRAADGRAQALTRMASDLASSAATRASGIFDCAADTVEDDSQDDDFFADGRPASPMGSGDGGGQLPHGDANRNGSDIEKNDATLAATGTAGSADDDFDLLAAGARIFDCAAHTVHAGDDNNENDDFFDDGGPALPTSNGDNAGLNPLPNGNANHNESDIEAADDVSTLTPGANDDEPVTATTASSVDEFPVSNLPDASADCITVESGSNDVSEEPDSAPTPNKKRRRRLLLGAAALLLVLAIGVGVALQQTIDGRGASSLEQNDSGTKGAPTAKPGPTSAPMKGPAGEFVVYQPIFDGVPSPSAAQTPSPNSDAQSSGGIPTPSVPQTQSPNFDAQLDESPDQSTVAATASPESSGNEVVVPSEPSISWEGFNRGTASPSRRPTESAEVETIRPSLRPVTAAPTSGSTVVPTGQPNPAATENEPTSQTSNPTTKRPTKQPSGKPTQLFVPDPTRSPTDPPTPPPSPPPTPLPSKQPTARPNSVAAFAGKSDSEPLESTLRIELKTDEYGEETSWFLYSIDAATGTRTALVASVPEDTYAPFEQDTKEIILAPGKYRWVLKDEYGDGFCCNNGRDGWYAISLDGRELIRGANYMKEVSYEIVVGYDWVATMSDRDREWLDAHNSRRKTWHERYGKTFVPLVWAASLAADASSWANELLDDCDIEGIAHESDVVQGENLAKNKGSTDAGMGKLYPPENILRRWVDQEETWGWPANAHLTQALWRASMYVGCGDGVREYPDGSICRTQVCRYVRAGNCAMSQYDAQEGDNWLAPMLMKHTRCGPACPREGCF